MLGTLAAIARAREQEPILRRAIPGIHLEGPFLSPEDGPRGAHPADSIRDPDWDLFRQFQEAAGGLIRLVTIAPERPGAIGVISQLRQAGIVVGIGHTDAKDTDIDQAVEAGAGSPRTSETGPTPCCLAIATISRNNWQWMPWSPR